MHSPNTEPFYTCNLEVYVYKQLPGELQLRNASVDLTLRIIEHISGSGCHLTVDNWYGSIPLAKQLLHNYRITMFKKYKEIPPFFID